MIGGDPRALGALVRDGLGVVFGFVFQIRRGELVREVVGSMRALRGVEIVGAYAEGDALFVISSEGLEEFEPRKGDALELKSGEGWTVLDARAVRAAGEVVAFKCVARGGGMA